MADYSDLGAVPVKTKNNYSDLGAVPMSAKVKSIGPRGWLDKASTFIHEAGQFPENFANAATFGAGDIIDSAMDKIGVPKLPPGMRRGNAVTPFGKISGGLGTVAGSFEGPVKAAAAVGRRILPGMTGRMASTLRSAGEGAAFGASMPGDIKQRGTNALAGAIANPAIGAFTEGLQPNAVRIARNIIRPTGKYASRGKALAETSLEEGVLRHNSGGTAQASQEVIDNLMSQVDDLAKNSNIDVSMKPAFQRAAAAAKYWISEGKPDRASKILKEIQNLATAKGINSQTSLPASRFLNVRRSGDAALKKLTPGGGFFSQTVPPGVEGRQEFLGGMRRALGKAIPEIGEKNQRISKLIDLANAASKRENVSSRNDLLGLKDYILAVGAKNNPDIWPILLAKKAWQGGQGLAARGMYNTGKLARQFGERIRTLGGEDVSETIPRQLGNSGARKLLSAERGPITTAIPKPELETGARTLRAPYYLEESPISFDVPSNPVLKKSTIKKYGINPFTGKMKPQKALSALEIALKRAKGKK